MAITEFPINTTTFEELEPITDAQSTDSDGVMLYDESVGVMKRMTKGELFKGKVIPIDDITGFLGIDYLQVSDRQQYHLNSFAPGGESGGGSLMWSSTLPKILHDGVRYFSPTVPMPADFDNEQDVQDYKDGVGEEFPADLGIFVLTSFSIQSSEFPAVDNAIVLFDGVSGNRVKNGPKPTEVGVNLIEFPDSEFDGYLRKKNDNTLELLTGGQLKTNLSLNNVDNTSDSQKVSSGPIFDALDLKADVIEVDDALALKADLESPAFTGNPTTPTPGAGDDSQSIASTAYVQGELSDRVQSVATIADLRALSGDTGKVVHCADVDKHFTHNTALSFDNNYSAVQSATGTWIAEGGNEGKVDVFVIYGQSNARGSAANTTGRPDISDSMSYWSRANQDIRKWVHTAESAYDDSLVSTGNSWAAFGNEYSARTGRKILLVPCAIGGTSIGDLSKGGAIYAASLIEYNNAMAELTALGWPIGNTLCLWHHGETNQSGSSSEGVYRVAMTTLFDDMVADFDIEHFFISLVGNPTSRTQSRWHTVRSAQQYLAQTRVDCSVAFAGCPYFYEENGYLRSDGTHYTQIGYNLMGTEMGSFSAQAVESGLPSKFGIESNRYAEVDGALDVKHVAFTIRLNSAGATILDRDNNSAFYASFVTDLPTVSSTEISVPIAGIRVDRVFNLHANAVNVNDRGQFVDARVWHETDTDDSIFIKIRLNQNATFIIDTADGSVTRPDLVSTSSFSVAADGTDYTSTHNTSAPPIITRASPSTTSTTATMVYRYVSPTSFKVPSGTGLAICNFPDFTIRPNAIPVGDEVLISVSAMVCFHRD